MLLVCCALFPFAAAAADDDMSLIDLFGEDAKKEEPAAEPIAEPEPPTEPQKAKDEEKDEVQEGAVESAVGGKLLKKPQIDKNDESDEEGGKEQGGKKGRPSLPALPSEEGREKLPLKQRPDHRRPPFPWHSPGRSG